MQLVEFRGSINLPRNSDGSLDKVSRSSSHINACTLLLVEHREALYHNLACSSCFTKRKVDRSVGEIALNKQIHSNFSIFVHIIAWHPNTERIPS